MILAALPSSRGSSRFLAVPFEAMVALLSVFTGVRVVVTGGVDDPVMSVSPLLLGYAWAVSYAISGVLVLWGIYRSNASVETAGLVWLAGGIAVNVAASSTFAGAGVLDLVARTGFLVVCLIRAYVLTKPADVVLVEPLDVVELGGLPNEER